SPPFTVHPNLHPDPGGGGGMRASVDFAEARARADLHAVVRDALGEPEVVGGSPRWRCPFHDDASPSFYLWADGRRWRCWPCGLQGDAIDFISRYDGLTKAEAARKLGGLPGPRHGPPDGRRRRRRPGP